ncbi:hypothetical protein [Psychroflexus sp. ALD_RP9]|uniref:hypothetical protein n=1 Tax=Psychroflexus sp. ALD_RP9 TaxID=2777186 RepID=UPI001A8C9C26|nr:hypothetical protein [Psychroflexus sp. ALD_RP9]QSS96311.1 hypothetical protein IMZ30_07535 [Psychroflexus sp. ALD_RP9]
MLSTGVGTTLVGKDIETIAETLIINYDVILIYTNSNLESKKRIKTNLADFSTSRYPNNSYNRVYYGTQSGNTLYIFGSYELKQ